MVHGARAWFQHQERCSSSCTNREPGGTFQPELCCCAWDRTLQRTALSTLPRGVLCEEELLVPSWKFTCNWTKLPSARLGLCSKSSLPHHPSSASFTSFLISPLCSKLSHQEFGFSLLLNSMLQFHFDRYQECFEKTLYMVNLHGFGQLSV